MVTSYVHTVRHTAAKFRMVIKLEERKIFTGSTTLPDLGDNFVTRMLGRVVFITG